MRFLSITAFEFKRHLDFRGELLGLLLLAAIAAVKLSADTLVAQEAAALVHINAYGTPVAGLSHGRFQFDDTPTPSLTVEPTLAMQGDRYRLKIERPPAWQAELQRSLDTLHRQQVLSALGVSPGQRDRADSPVQLTILSHEGRRMPEQAPLAALSITAVMLTTLAILTGLAMIFHGLLTERFTAATEMILSATPAGFWLDCKVAASILHGLKLMLLYGLYAAAGWMLISDVLFASLHLADHSPTHLPLLLLFSLCGLLLWNWLFAACATAIRSPHSSFRNALAAFPVTMVMVGLGGLRTPDGMFMQVVSLLPFTSMAAMPVRLLYVPVPLWEVLLSLASLLTTATLLRLWAKRNFGNAIVSAHSQRPRA